MYGLGTLSFLIFIFIVIFISLMEDLLMGDSARRKYIIKFYNSLKGKEENEKKKKQTGLKKAEGKYYLIYALSACTGAFFLALLTLKSFGMALIISLFGFIYPHIKMKNAEKKKRELLNQQLKDAMSSLASSLKAGMSINSALVKCTHDLEKLYFGQKEKPILEEFIRISDDLTMGLSVDDALNNFKARVKLEDVEDFVNSVIIVRQKGGNMAEVMNNVAGIISDKISVKREIEVLTAAKKAEAKIITGIPIFMLVALSLLAPHFLEPMYNNVLGKILIIFGLLLLVINYYVGRKIVDIKI